MRIYIDRITHRPIEYDDNSVFTIYSKGSHRKKMLVDQFPSDKIQEALDFFYNLEIPIGYRKHFVVADKTILDGFAGKIIYNMEGFLPNSNTMDLRKNGKALRYEKSASLNLVNTPASISKKLELLEYNRLPFNNEKWTKTKIMYCLLSFFLSLNNEDRNKLLSRGHRMYIAEKLESGGKLEEAERFRKLNTNTSWSDLL